MSQAEEVTNPRGTLPPEAPATRTPQLDAAREFASVVGNMLDTKLEPINGKLDRLTRNQEHTTDKVNDHEQRLQRIERRPEVYVSWVALLLCLVCFGGMLATFYQAQAQAQQTQALVQQLPNVVAAALQRTK